MRGIVRASLGGVAALAAVVAGSPRVVSEAPHKAIELTSLGVYTTAAFDEGAVEIAAYDPETRRAFVTFANRPRLDIVDLADPAHPVQAGVVDLAPWGPAAHATSVAVRGGILAVAVPQGEDDTDPGKVLFFDTTGVLLNEVTVGALPDMITFTPNGSHVLTANEGQPNDAYTVDPEGSVSLVDLRNGVETLGPADVVDIGFSDFNDAALDSSIRVFGPGATVAQDLEPEYIAVSHDSRVAWVTLQENNALATVDLRSKRVTRLVGLGFKDHSRAGHGLDGSRDDKAIGIGRWPVWGMYLPDAIAGFGIGSETFLATANEGDAREYGGLNDAGEEPVEIEDLALDPTAFPDAATLQHRTRGIGRLKVTPFQGDTDGDGDFDRLFAFGARSFSIWTPDGRLVFDSGDALERITGAAFPASFNASNTNGTLDDRSDDKGPEPEGVVVAPLFGRTCLFVMLERIGGIVVYDISDPRAPHFIQYVNTREFGAPPSSAAAGDLGPEAATFVPAESSPSGRPLLLVTNEVSGSLRVFEISPAR